MERDDGSTDERQQGTYVKYSLEVNSAVTFFNLGTTGVLRWVILCHGELFCTLLKTTDILEEEEAELNEARRGNQGDSWVSGFPK